ncbi:hypothetical protein HanIR_Chr01g0017301 [Helianthus annuus]|nr:hypothetical protein HanIR_Chr01g0017301 [Helianthus annuus]
MSMTCLTSQWGHSKCKFHFFLILFNDWKGRYWALFALRSFSIMPHADWTATCRIMLHDRGIILFNHYIWS